MFIKLLNILKKNGVYIIKDLFILFLILTFIVGTVLYLYKYHKKKESYALNIVLTAFVSRMTGVEFLEAIKVRILKISYYLQKIIYKKQYIDANRKNDAEESQGKRKFQATKMIQEYLEKSLKQNDVKDYCQNQARGPYERSVNRITNQNQEQQVSEMSMDYFGFRSYMCKRSRSNEDFFDNQ
ncbi:UNKNOWN [Stylonychia lemnae]|uniref:Transmembrane protein n=1 Tax=Stylonychia lemnae TaxID=5949 RepID=A0A078ACC3_STYLE|nr:UNKNOWN [Stylonychia lemnae]|eukprot:CDW78468.1 UNKNOWN [Stylonychia lemnae]